MAATSSANADSLAPIPPEIYRELQVELDERRREGIMVQHLTRILLPLAQERPGDNSRLETSSSPTSDSMYLSGSEPPSRQLGPDSPSSTHPPVRPPFRNAPGQSRSLLIVQN
jgi:hypothetical protein